MITNKTTNKKNKAKNIKKSDHIRNGKCANMPKNNHSTKEVWNLIFKKTLKKEVEKDLNNSNI